MKLKCWSLKQGMDGRWTLSLSCTHCYTTHSHSTQVSCLAQALRLASRDHLMDLACSRELEQGWLKSVAGGRGYRVRVVGNGRQQCLAT